VKALVTGGAGFIGSNVVRALVSGGHEVRVLHVPGENLRNLEGLDVELLEGDVTDAGGMRTAVRGVDRVFHLAAIYALWLRRPERMREVNVGGTENVLRAAADAGVERVVYTSSIAVFGGQGLDADANESSVFKLGSTGDLYSMTKLEAHRVALDWAGKGLDVTIVAPCGPIGPGDVRPTPTGKMLLSAFNLPAPVLVHTSANLGDVRDMAEAHLLAGDRGKTGETYLLGHANVRPTDLAKLALSVFGFRRTVLTVPNIVASAAAYGALAVARVTKRAPLVTPAAVEIAKLGLRADCTKAARELGMNRRPLADSVRDAVVWWAKAGYIRSDRVSRRILAAA